MWSPDGWRLFDNPRPRGLEVVRVSASGEPFGAGGRQLEVVVDWFEELRARVPAAR